MINFHYKHIEMCKFNTKTYPLQDKVFLLEQKTSSLEYEF